MFDSFDSVWHVLDVSLGDDSCVVMYIISAYSVVYDLSAFFIADFIMTRQLSKIWISEKFEIKSNTINILIINE